MRSKKSIEFVFNFVTSWKWKKSYVEKIDYEKCVSKFVPFPNVIVLSYQLWILVLSVQKTKLFVTSLKFHHFKSFEVAKNGRSEY